jgi:hypothetical protein
MKELQAETAKCAAMEQLGHGAYSELGGGLAFRNIGDITKRLFNASKRVGTIGGAHFYRFELCDVVHAHLETDAPQHLETRFKSMWKRRSTVAVPPILVEQLGIVILPTVLIVRNRKAVHHIFINDGAGPTPTFSDGALARLLGQHDGIQLAKKNQK